MSRIKAIFHHLRKRPRLLTATVLGGALFLLSSALLPEAKFPRSTRALLAWDIGTLLYLVLAWVMMVRASVESVRSRARVRAPGARRSKPRVRYNERHGVSHAYSVDSPASRTMDRLSNAGDSANC